jgi:hypothetical protein
MMYGSVSLVVQVSVKPVLVHDVRSASASSVWFHLTTVSTLAAIRRATTEVATPFWLAEEPDPSFVPSLKPSAK